MLRRVNILLQNSFNISSNSRVAIFPLHLDPPTAQHRELFKLLLGVQAKNETKFSAEKEVKSNNNLPFRSSESSSESESSTATQSLEPNKRLEEQCKEISKETCKAHELPHERCHNYIGELLTKYRLSKKYWYMAPLADSLHEDSQFAPFDDLLLIPNTRYPVSLKRSTHLAAMSILATRNLPHVHVDFTALEHPNESMPVIYELVNEFPHSVLVHWLHDAYEMQHWRYFSEIKRRVPLLLLQTISYEPILLTHEPPVLGNVTNADSTTCSNKISVTSNNAKEREAGSSLAEEVLSHTLSSRQYISPEQKDAIESSNERHYYELVAEHLRARHAREQSLKRSQEIKEQQGNRSYYGNSIKQYGKGKNWENEENNDDYDDVDVVNKDNIEVVNIVHGPHEKRELEGKIQKQCQWNSKSDNNNGDENKVNYNNTDVREYKEREATLEREMPFQSQNANKGYENGAVQHEKWKQEQQRQDEEDEYVKGEWWHTKGGRGDDVVEISRSYLTSEGSSWLGIASASSSHSPSAVLSGTANSRSQNGDARSSGKDRSSMWQTSFGTAKGKQRANSAKSKPSQTRTVCQLLDELYPLHFSLLHSYKRHASEETSAEMQTNKPVNQEGLSSRRNINLRCGDYHNNYNSDVKEGAAATNTQSSNVNMAVKTGNSPNCQNTSSNQINSRQTRPIQSQQFSPSSVSSVPSSVFFPSSRVGQRELPMVEVHPITRCTGADVRQALWEEEIEPSLILTDSVARYVESHALYRDSRKFLSSSVNGPATFTSNNTKGFAANSFNKANSNPHANRLSQWHSNLMPSSSSTSTNSSSSSTSSSMASLGAHIADSHDRYKNDISNVNSFLGGRYLDSQLGMPNTIVESPFSSASHARMFAESMHEGSDTNNSSSDTNNDNNTNKSTWPHQSSPTMMHRTGKSSSSSSSLSLFNSSSRRSLQRDSMTIMNFSGLIPRLELHYDKSNLLAREQFEMLKVFQVPDNEEPDLIVPIGGDGYMMHCIRRNWRRFIPFYGVNAGHVGYLLNERSTLEELFTLPLKLYMTTMLYCQAERETEHGEHVLLSELAFNDAWVERASGQTALIRILVNGEERIRKLRGDGVLVSTAAGSTAYSKALGASPLPVGAPLIQVVGSNVVSPAQWRPVHLDQEDEVEFEVMDTNKRPCRCFVDSVDLGNVSRMLVRSSRVASVSLAFSQSFDLQQKLYKMQFPQAVEKYYN